MEELRRPFSEAEAGFYVAEITLALEHLHTNGITFRDLKPEVPRARARSRVVGRPPLSASSFSFAPPSHTLTTRVRPRAHA